MYIKDHNKVNRILLFLFYTKDINYILHIAYYNIFTTFEILINIKYKPCKNHHLNKLSILLFIIVILSSCNKDNGIEEISESYIEIKVLRISKDNTKTPIYNAIAYIYYDIAPIDLANYTDKGNGIYSNGKNTIIPNQVKRTNIDGYLEIKPEETIHSITVFIHDTNSNMISHS